MKNKAPLALIELVMMILIFALAAGLCLQAFLWSAQQSETIALRDDAVLAVQNLAEELKSGKTTAENLAVQDYGKFIVETRPLDPDTDGLGGAAVCARNLEGEELFSLQIYWQEALKGGEGGGGNA